MLTIQTYHGDHWNVVASFDNFIVDLDIVKNCALHIGDKFQNKICFISDVAVIDSLTGEVYWNYANDVAGGWK